MILFSAESNSATRKPIPSTFMMSGHFAVGSDYYIISKISLIINALVITTGFIIFPSECFVGLFVAAGLIIRNLL